MPWALPEYSQAPLALVVHSWKRPPKDLPVGRREGRRGAGLALHHKGAIVQSECGDARVRTSVVTVEAGSGHRVPGTANGLRRYHRCARSTPSQSGLRTYYERGGRMSLPQKRDGRSVSTSESRSPGHRSASGVPVTSVLHGTL